MKEIALIWNRFLGGRYTSVSTDPSAANARELEDASRNVRRNSRSLTRKSSVVVNQFFNAALPLHSDGRPRWSSSIFVYMILGLLGLGAGAFILLVEPYEMLFKLKVVFGEGGEIFELWRKPPVDLYLKVYLFNVTNHEEYMSGKEDKLRFQEIGPYVYKESMEHGSVRFNGNGTVAAVPLHPLKYLPEASNGTEEDLLILPNIALLSITNVMRESSFFTRIGLNMLIRQTATQPLVRMTAKEFMFGYESTLVTLGNHLMPSWIKFDKLGLIDRMYDFEGDFETVYTGENDVRMTGLIEKYNGDYNLPQWTEHCGNVKGASDGAKFPSYIEPNDTLLFFRKSLCRSARMIRTGEKTVKGMSTYTYKFMENELDNGATRPENKCFCRQGRCLPAGLIDVTDCYYGFPIALSYPHFFKADPSLLANVEGLEPRAENHESFFHIQPKSGLPVELAFRFQINMALQNIKHMANVEKFDKLVLPLLWFEISMNELPEAMNNRFLLYLNILPTAQEVLMYLLFIGGAVSLVWSVVKILLYQPRDSDGSPANWFETEMKRTKGNMIVERPAISAKEMETYYSTLLSPDIESSMPLENLPCLKQEIV